MADTTGNPAAAYQRSRGENIDALLKTYNEATDNDEPAARDAGPITCLLTDIRHWCDVNGVDYFGVEQVSYVAYSAELRS